MKRPFLLPMAFLVFTSNLFSQTMPTSKTDSILKVSKVNDFEVTGTGTAAAWKNAEWISLPKRKGTAEYKTQFKIVYSEKGVYCLYFCEDNIITSTIKKDFGDLFREDVVEVFFWPDESSPIYFEYELSPCNFELPILVPNHKGDFHGWLPWGFEGPRKTRHATKINEEGGKPKSWTAEFFIPYDLMRPLQNLTPKKGMRWRANFYRIDYDNGVSTWTWKPIRKTFHDYEKFGVIEFQ
jgi:hypothetical protein